eukprot:ctg_372.g233
MGSAPSCAAAGRSPRGNASGTRRPAVRADTPARPKRRTGSRRTWAAGAPPASLGSRGAAGAADHAETARRHRPAPPAPRPRSAVAGHDAHRAPPRGWSGPGRRRPPHRGADPEWQSRMPATAARGAHRPEYRWK